MIGSCEFFDSAPFLKAADILVAADEPLRALDLLRNLPGFYRDNVPAEIAHKIGRIQARLATPAFYSQNIHDQNILPFERALECLRGTLRGQLIEKDVNAFGIQGKVPHIVDLGPGEYWLPIALMAKQAKFTYQDIGLSPQAKKKAYEVIEPVIAELKSDDVKRPTIFVACELIEHLHYEGDIRVEYERNGVKADIIHISTPKYTWDGRHVRISWDHEGGDLGHLRTYTPQEFILKVQWMFPEFEWQFYDSQVMHMRGVRKS